uniref:Uncharacterized protein n=1 Tax=Anguilla anguilla TaxID=7936 RepID=A0A0E9SUD4_ANGAN
MSMTAFHHSYWVEKHIPHNSYIFHSCISEHTHKKDKNSKFSP